MIRRRVTFTALVLGGLVASGLATGTAWAGSSPPPPAGCDGTGCYGQLWHSIHFGGSGDPSGAPPSDTSLAGMNIQPPACWYADANMNGAQMYAFMEQQLQSPAGAQDNAATFFAAMQSEIIKDKSLPGEWYIVTGPPLVSNAELSCIQHEAGANDQNYYVFVPPGGAPPPPPGITAGDLAEMAYAAFQVPTPNVTLNPAAKSYVNLPTFLTVTPPAGAINNELYVTVTVDGGVPGPVTVAATPAPAPNGLNISAPGGTPYTNGCGPTGSIVKNVTSYGAGTTPDCGVVYQQPSSGSTLSVTQSWTPTAYEGGFVPGAPDGGLLPAGTQALRSQQPFQQAVPVAEIQSVNGGA